MAASPRQRQRAADVLRENGTYAEAAVAAGVNVSTIKRWRGHAGFRAMIIGSPDIRVGAPPPVGRPPGTLESQRDTRLRMWVADSAVLGSYIPPASFENPAA